MAGAGEVIKARSFLAPTEFLDGPRTVPKDNVINRPSAATLEYLLRFKRLSDEPFVFSRAELFFNIESPFA